IIPPFVPPIFWLSPHIFDKPMPVLAETTLVVENRTWRRRSLPMSTTDTENSTWSLQLCRSSTPSPKQNETQSVCHFLIPEFKCSSLLLSRFFLHKNLPVLDSPC